MLPFESVEYKYQLSKGSGLVYSWVASDVVSVDFHGEPEAGPEGYAESFNIGNLAQQQGVFKAPFSGIHGWFWENRGNAPVLIELNAAGFFTGKIEFRDGFVNHLKLAD